MTSVHHQEHGFTLHHGHGMPLDYSHAEEAGGAILDLCMRKVEPNNNSPSPPHITLLQQQLLRPVQALPIEEINISLPLSAQVFNGSTRGSKPTRPFKAYPKDPLSLAAGVATAEALLGQTSTEAYTEFRRRMLEQVQAVGSKMRSPAPAKGPVSPQQPSSTDGASSGGEGRDAAYWERRRRNNEAAKRSRDARRAKEDEIAIRAAFLEQENLKLKYEVAALRSELAKLRCLIYTTS